MTSERETSALFIGGRSGVGKTTVAYELSRLLAAADVAHALIEGDNLDQAHPEPWRRGLQLAERNLRAVWGNYRAAGYHRVIYTNTVSVLEIEGLSQALSGDVVATGVLLQAGDAATADRLARREHGESLREHVERSAARSLSLQEQAPAGVHRVDTDGRSPVQVAQILLRLTGWTTPAS